MEELSAMMYVNQYRREGRYDVLVLDCAPTAESLRFVSMPTTLEWYMKHIFPFQRTMLKAVRPIANRVSPVELPPDNYFSNIAKLFGRLEGVDTLLSDPLITSVRLVTNPERMVLRETQRTFVYFSLHGLTVDAILVNRLLPGRSATCSSAIGARRSRRSSAKWRNISRPLRCTAFRCLRTRCLAARGLRNWPGRCTQADEDPAAVVRAVRPYTFEKLEDRWEVHLDLPFASKSELGLFKKGDELVVEIGTLRRHIGLPTSMAALGLAGASGDGNWWWS